MPTNRSSEFGGGDKYKWIRKNSVETKKVTPLVKKPLTKTIKNSPPKEVVSNKNFTPPSPIRPSTKMSTPATPSRGCYRPSESRVPSTARPSSKQGQRGPSSVTRDDLQPCKYCDRRFLEDRLGVHEDICSKTLKKKRKVYDATKHRVTGTELEPYTRKMNKPCVQKQSRVPPKKNDWRKKHEEFISAIRAAKQLTAYIASGGKASDIPPPPPAENPDYIQCPHCGRRFNQTAAERHIPKCATFQFNKPKQSVRLAARK